MSGYVRERGSSSDRCGSNSDDGGAICYNLQLSYLSSCTIFAGQLACLTPTVVDTSIIGSVGWYFLNATKHVRLRFTLQNLSPFVKRVTCNCHSQDEVRGGRLQVEDGPRDAAFNRCRMREKQLVTSLVLLLVTFNKKS